MASTTSELATLRAITFRISSTPTAQLPQHVPAITASLASCRTLLSSTQSSGAKAASSEASVAIHKFRTLLSTLLQDRTIHGRWAAIVLIKATIEVGGWETLQKCLPWVRGLLSFLTKPEPPSSHKLCIITLTRIFILTRDYPTLVREITTPSLPTFIQSTLQIASGKATPPTLLQTVLESFHNLLPRHPTIFRSHLKQLQPLLSRLIAPTPSSKLGQEQVSGPRINLTSEVVAAARRLHVQIPCCAPKGASSEDWQKALKTTISAAHDTADLVFRAVLEDWQSTARVPSSGGNQILNDQLQDLETNSMGLPPWSGIYAGAERLTQLLSLTNEYLKSSTANSVYVNIGAIMDLATRILSLTVPASGGKSFQHTVRLNNQVSREERENLWLVLPTIHVAAVELVLSLLSRTQKSTLALDSLLVDQLVWVFGSEKDNLQLRAACYTATSALLKRSGSAFLKSTIDSLVPLIRACCEDLLPSQTAVAPNKPTPGQTKANGTSQPQITANADTFLNSSKSENNPTSGFLGLEESTYNLLPVLLANVPAQYLSDSLRGRLDRTAILTQHKDAMMASVLNAPPSKKFGKPAASILPLMARSFPNEMDVEGMLRPRMPVIRLGGQDVDVNDTEEEDSVEIDEENDEAEDPESETDKFVGSELDAILQSSGQSGIEVQDFAMRDAPTTGSNALVSDTSDVPKSPVSAPTKFVETTKRTINEQTPSSPSKRIKTIMDNQSPIQTTSASATAALTDFSFQETFTPQPSDFAATSTASNVPELPQPQKTAIEGGDSDDDDDDDVIPLVFGQDTDDESE
ncbi:hypothetical protein IQ07DRAFT_538294 [Pyrenochaeta sp. DS3sAY3a]|nr:hypothetical protein IQ07DRAFT_538294 [Pyrenochaeta sp. DS3sAY3a]